VSPFSASASFFINARHKRSVYANSCLLHLHALVMRHANLDHFTVQRQSLRQRASSFVPRVFIRAFSSVVPAMSFRLTRVGSVVSHLYNWMTARPCVVPIGVYGTVAITDAKNVKRPPAGSRLSGAS
jgi:hypothetical protein